MTTLTSLATSVDTRRHTTALRFGPLATATVDNSTGAWVLTTLYDVDSPESAWTVRGTDPRELVDRVEYLLG